MKVKLTKDSFGFWNYTILIGKNQQTLKSSKGYTRQRDAVRAVRNLAENLPDAEIVVVA